VVIRPILRRQNRGRDDNDAAHGQILQFGDLQLNTSTREVLRGER